MEDGEWRERVECVRYGGFVGGCMRWNTDGGGGVWRTVGRDARGQETVICKGRARYPERRFSITCIQTHVTIDLNPLEAS